VENKISDVQTVWLKYLRAGSRIPLALECTGTGMRLWTYVYADTCYTYTWWPRFSIHLTYVSLIFTLLSALLWSLLTPRENILTLYPLTLPVCLLGAAEGAHIGNCWTATLSFRPDDLLTATRANPPAPLLFVSNQLCPVKMWQTTKRRDSLIRRCCVLRLSAEEWNWHQASVCNV